MNHDLITKEMKHDIGEALWRARREKRSKLETVANAVGCLQGKIDLLEMGRIFDYNLLRKLAKYYGKDIKISFE